MDACSARLKNDLALGPRLSSALLGFSLLCSGWLHYKLSLVSSFVRNPHTHTASLASSESFAIRDLAGSTILLVNNRSCQAECDSARPPDNHSFESSPWHTRVAGPVM